MDHNNIGKEAMWYILIILSFFSIVCSDVQIRVNQVGYLKYDHKTAIAGANHDLKGLGFNIKNIHNNQIIYNGVIGSSISGRGADTPFKFNYIIDFTKVTSKGSYKISIDESAESYVFNIGNDIYKGIIDSLLFFMRFARCGHTNPVLHKICHLYDPTNLDWNMTGGWHDAGDFIKFTHKETYTTYILLLSYQLNKEKYLSLMSDNDNNGIADILDEAKIGVDHLVKLYPNEQTFVHRIGDIKADHRELGILPEEDVLDRTNRPALIGFDRNPLAKYAYAMALAYNIYKDIQLFSLESQQYIVLARRAYEKAKITGSGHIDKLCLAAVELYLATKESKYLEEAKIYNDQLSWNNYGHYPNNTNLAHARLAPHYQNAKNKLKTSVRKFYESSSSNLFGFDVEYSWGSLYIALSSANQGWLYSLLADDDSYSALQTRIRDYTLGFNPWGVCFISGMGTEYPINIHNSPVVALKKLGKLKEGTIPGAVAEGPINRSYWEKNYGNFVSRYQDKYYRYHTSACVYHDHVNDYVTNEPCSYGVAETILFFSFYLRYQSNEP